ncbi:HupE/UreJ family protein [Asticcacaulis sp. 201]|uniref:HupE/UreJ family protein n=1 Tax=Asticcacaulis sp. 201 TaxID=3028787 RepID=UPI00291616A7|nr:HupE/UreJ family protein [Asticcacaulis sp. 201]MDV6330618.1 HupE/UreJ family protein [Asticcacaulis sp. 201]
MKKPIYWVAALSALAATPALAHPGHLNGEGPVAAALDGLIHPLTGADHLLAMVAVGFWAAQYSQRKGLWLPAGFVTGMLVGALLGFSGLNLPGFEAAIALSLCTIGAGLVFRDRLPIIAAGAVCAAAGLFHGYAHAREAGGSALPFVIGFAVTTSLLHLAGGLMGVWAGRLRHAAPLVGGVVAVAGLVLLAS